MRPFPVLAATLIASLLPLCARASNSSTAGTPTASPAPVLFVTHSSMYWDKNLRFRDAIEGIVRDARAANFRIVDNEDLAGEPGLTTYGDDSPLEHPLPENWSVGGLQPNERNQSSAGEHQVVGAARRLVVTGGNLSACLCRTIRDALISTASLEEVPTLVVATDAVYEGPRRLSEMMATMNDEIFLKHLSLLFLNPQTGGLCKVDHQGPNFQLEIRREEVVVARYGQPGSRPAVIDFRSAASAFAL